MAEFSDVSCKLQAHSFTDLFKVQTMTRVEQHKIIETLEDYMHKMQGRDLDEFEMMRKRDRDDEELDLLTRHQLSELYIRYVPERLR